MLALAAACAGRVGALAGTEGEQPVAMEVPKRSFGPSQHGTRQGSPQVCGISPCCCPCSLDAGLDSVRRKVRVMFLLRSSS